ncbi:MAG: mandelate racemase/muconate lactonizing enzyme family protein [Acidilobaceae archaeon]
MIIKQVYIAVLNFPTAHYISGWRPVTRTSHLITFLLTNSGIIGMGEGTPYWSNIVDDYDKTLSLAREIQRLSLEDALNVLRSIEYSEFRRSERVNYGAFLALESAIINALAQLKKAEREAEVLGGVYRTEIPIAYTIFLGHPTIMSRKLGEAIKSGYKHIKFKIPCNLEELRRLLEALHPTRKQYKEEVVLRADANECFSTLERAEKAFSVMEKYGVNIVEQPMPRDMLRDIAILRKRFYPAIEIMLDESLRKPSDIKLFAQLEIADAVNFHPSKLGCLTVSREAILQTQRLGMKVNIGSALMTEIGFSHYLNLAASIPSLDYPLEEPGVFNLYGYGITWEPIEIINGRAILHSIDVSDIDFSMMKRFSTNSLFKERLLMLLSKGYGGFIKVKNANTII